MNMDKVGLADAMSMVLAFHDVKNESGVQEDADIDAQFKSRCVTIFKQQSCAD